MDPALLVSTRSARRLACSALLVGACAGSRVPLGAPQPRRTESPAPVRQAVTVPDEPDKPDEPDVVLYERVLPSMWGYTRPLFGADDAITVDDRMWDAAGRYLGHNLLERGGQLEPMAMLGSGDSRRIVALGWDALDEANARDHRAEADETHGAERGSWLTIGAPTQDIDRASFHAIDAEFAPGTKRVAISPDGTRIALAERDRIVIRELSTGAEIAGAVHAGDEDPLVCWVGEASVTWLDPGSPASWVSLAAARGATKRAASVPPISGRPAACDPGGGAVAIVTADGAIASVDLATGAVIGRVAAPAGSVDDVAVADHGRRLAVAIADEVTLLSCRRGACVTRFSHRWPAAANPRLAASNDAPPDAGRDDAPPWSDFFHLQFDHDGRRLAIVGETLVVVGPASAARAAPEVPAISFTMPRGFAAVDQVEDTSWPGVPTPSGAASFPAVLLRARARTRLVADVTVTALDADELRAYLPSPTASAAELRHFGATVMDRFSDVWRSRIPPPSADRDPEAELTLRVGHTENAIWATSRVLVRDGCEPYDGYTRVVYDRARDLVILVQAVTTPGESIAGWLAAFLDIPFHLEDRERHAGPPTGPC